jgi:hypothetical protein
MVMIKNVAVLLPKQGLLGAVNLIAQSCRLEEKPIHSERKTQVLEQRTQIVVRCLLKKLFNVFTYV